jgi:hypothetical protein
MPGRKKIAEMARLGLLAGLLLTLVIGAAAPARAAGDDYDLAFKYRPVLRFDSAETWRPLNIDLFLWESRFGRQHHICATAAGSCDVISEPGDLNRGAVLDIAGEAREGADYSTPQPIGCRQPAPLRDCDSGDRSAIYYDISRRRGRAVIDYWWFLRFNYVRFAAPLKCRFKVCLDHEGDWEGVRVIPPAGGADLEVHYDAHGRSESYIDIEPETATTGRPVVYVARGTHASYPRPCAPERGLCRQTGTKLPDGRFNGQAGWGRNTTGDCGQTCLLPLPVGSWADWPGRWGRDCDRGGCHRIKGPDSPRRQNRSRLCLLRRDAFTSISIEKGLKWVVRYQLHPKSECV